MRTLVGDGTWDWPEGPWLRVNMVATVDGSAQGPDGLSGSINNGVDAEVFHRLRATADVVLVGAGTVRAESYGPAGKPLAVVGHALPPALAGADGVRLVGGDLTEVVGSLQAEFPRVLCEGGPTLLAALLRLGLVDELCTTTVPLVVGGDGRRMLDGPSLDARLSLASLVEDEGTLLARWLVA